MIKRTTWIYFFIFLVLVVAAIYLQRKEESAPAETESVTPVAIPTAAYLFDAQEGVVTSIFLESSQGKSLGLERLDSVWVATRPFEAEAVQSSVEAAASQVTALQVLDSLDLNDADVGLDWPDYTITIGFSNGNFVIVQVGDETPIGNGYYVRKEGGPVLVVDKYSLLTLLELLDFPPYVASPTPSPLPSTETPIPTEIPASETPIATKTP